MIMVGTNEREEPGLPESLIGLALSEVMIAHHRINLVFAFVFAFAFVFWDWCAKKVDMKKTQQTGGAVVKCKP